MDFLGRQRFQGALTEALDGKTLLYFGPRGTDGDPLRWYSDLLVASLISPPESVESVGCLESMTHRRVELNSYCWENDLSAAAEKLRSRYRKACRSRPTVLFSYRPDDLVTGCWLESPSQSTEYAGLFSALQKAFEFKPWVDRELRQLGITTLGWRYAQESLSEARGALSAGPIVLRRAQSSGGVGCKLVRGESELFSSLSCGSREGLWWSNYLSDSVSINVNATLFSDGALIFHPSSLQIIGADISTSYPLGYCGADFGRIKTMDSRRIRAIEQVVRRTADWLVRNGYRGAFGLDVLLKANSVYFVELNPRLQASSRLAATLDEVAERADQLMTHLAAFLGIRVREGNSLEEVISRQLPWSQITLYNRHPYPMAVAEHAVAQKGVRVTNVPAGGVVVEPGGILCTIEFREAITSGNGFLRDEIVSFLRGIREALEMHVGSP